MAQLVVRNLEESVKRRLKTRAKVRGRSLEGEVREILREAAAAALPAVPKAVRGTAQKGLGTLLAEHFAGKVPPEFKIPNIREELPRPAKFR
jgi:antitoxin FitA